MMKQTTPIYGQSSTEVSKRIKKSELVIDVVGIGNMGLPLAVAFAKAGAQVVGVGKDPEAIDLINAGKSPVFGEPDLPDLLREVVDQHRLKATQNGTEAAKQANAIVVIVPLLTGEKGSIDDSIIRNATSEIALGLQKGTLISIETTMPPGMVREIIIPLLEQGSGLVVGKDFGIVHSPERLTTGRVFRNLKLYPKIIGAYDKKSSQAAEGLYKPIVGEVLHVKSIETAELIKVTEGVYRDVNIALANQIAVLSESLDVDFWDVYHGATYRTQDYCHLHKAGAGVGGHCIPVYPYFLINAGKENGIETSILSTARDVNDGMVDYVTKKTRSCLQKNQKPSVGSNITVVGLAFRPDVKEIRLSPSLRLIDSLEDNLKAKVSVYDPLFSPEEIASLGYSPANLENLAESDCIVVVVLHSSHKSNIEEVLKPVLSKVVDATSGVFFKQSPKWKIGKPNPK
ncbi:MAG: nucleotide sugar dehydrogenase [Candidatus Ranarchaeia archaeon]|jgi:nucleotide sugar dehydrogenase